MTNRVAASSTILWHSFKLDGGGGRLGGNPAAPYSRSFADCVGSYAKLANRSLRTFRKAPKKTYRNAKP